MKILYDIFYAGNAGQSGIPQDTRLLLKTLAMADGIEVAALLHPFRRRRRLERSVKRGGGALAAAVMFSGVGAESDPAVKNKFLEYVENYIRRLVNAKGEKLTPIDADYIFDAIWRIYFSTTFSPSDRKLFRNLDYIFSSVGERELIRGDVFGRTPSIDTSNFDFVLFQDLRLASVSAKTTSLIRYHDPLPITAADTMVGAASPHFRAISRAQKSAVFICNSGPTRDQLVGLFPETESRAHVIPYTLTDLNSWNFPKIPVAKIVEARAGFHSVREKAVEGADKTLHDTLLQNPDFEYVLMVSTIEPRKNFPGAIAAVERLRERTSREIRFIIVGKLGWKIESILPTMEQGVRRGTIFHLTDVPFDELVNLYTNARALVFPSFGEGFGFPPMEALQCGTPSVVSDIPVHRWVMKDAVLYADPYDVESIAVQLERLVHSSEAESLRADLMSRGADVLRRYSREVTAAQWLDLLSSLKREKQNA